MSKRRSYTEEFKREAVSLVTDQGYTLAEAARSLGIHPNLLRTWKEKLSSQGGSALSPDEEAELKRLREENRRLRMERDILKKAAAFFANEKP